MRRSKPRSDGYTQKSHAQRVTMPTIIVSPVVVLLGFGPFVGGFSWRAVVSAALAVGSWVAFRRAFRYDYQTYPAFWDYMETVADGTFDRDVGRRVTRTRLRLLGMLLLGLLLLVSSLGWTALVAAR